MTVCFRVSTAIGILLQLDMWAESACANLQRSWLIPTTMLAYSYFICRAKKLKKPKVN